MQVNRCGERQAFESAQSVLTAKITESKRFVTRGVSVRSSTMVLRRILT